MTRLKAPLRFVDEANANSCIEASALAPLGAKAVPGAYGRWFIVIDARNVESIQRYLRTHMPGVEWTVTDASTEKCA